MASRSPLVLTASPLDATRSTATVTIVCLCLLVALASPVTASADASATDSSRSATTVDQVEDPAEVEAVVDAVMAERIGENVPGATVAVVEGDERVLTKGYGEANVETGRPVRANETTFRIGSVAKLITWTAVMQGVEDGRLDLDADITTYLDESAVEGPDLDEGPVTLDHLGTHTAGFDQVLHTWFVDSTDDLQPLEQSLAENEPPRVAPPGERVAYSNYGAALAGHIVAEASAMSFEEYVQAEIFGPLGMNHSTFIQPVPQDHPGERALPHTPDGDGFATVDPGYVNWYPAGSMTATGTDMAAFMSAHLGEGADGDARILDAETSAEMHATHYERRAAVNNWRYGFYEYGHPDEELLAHSGATIHYTAALVLAPEDDVGVFVAYNTRTAGAQPNDAVDEILEAYNLRSTDGTDDPTGGSGSLDRAQRVAGEYAPTTTPERGPGQILGLAGRLSVDATDDGRLVTSQLGQGEQEWVETEPGVYHEVDGDDMLAVDMDAGQVTALHRNEQPQTTYLPVATHERRLVVAGTLGIALFGFALSLLGWSGVGIWRRLRRWRADTGTAPVTASDVASESESESKRQGEDSQLTGVIRRRIGNPAWLTRAAGVALTIVSLAFVGAFLTAIATAGQLAFVMMPPALRLALVLPWLVAVLAIGTAIGTVLAWVNGYWSRPTRLHWTALTVLGIAFVWQLFALGFLHV